MHNPSVISIFHESRCNNKQFHKITQFPLSFHCNLPCPCAKCVSSIAFLIGVLLTKLSCSLSENILNLKKNLRFKKFRKPLRRFRLDLLRVHIAKLPSISVQIFTIHNVVPAIFLLNTANPRAIQSFTTGKRRQESLARRGRCRIIGSHSVFRMASKAKFPIRIHETAAHEN